MIKERYSKREIANHYRKAAKLLEDKGWCVGTTKEKTRGGSESYCAIGALGEVVGGNHRLYGVLDSNRKVGRAPALELRLTGRCSLLGFNDRARNCDEVTSLFRKIARALDHGANP